MQPSDFRNHISVGLRLDKPEYIRRLKERDRGKPHKKGQMSLDDALSWMSKMDDIYDVVYDAGNMDDLLHKFWSLLKVKNGGKTL